MSTLVFSLCSKQHTLVKTIQQNKAYPFSQAVVSIAKDGTILAYSATPLLERLIYTLSALVEHFSVPSLIILYPNTHNVPTPLDTPLVANLQEDEVQPCITLAHTLSSEAKPMYMDLPAAQLFPKGMQEGICSHPWCPSLFRALLMQFSHGEVVFAHCKAAPSLKQCFHFLIAHIAHRQVATYSQLLVSCVDKYHCTQTELTQIKQCLQKISVHEGIASLADLQAHLHASIEKHSFITLIQEKARDFHASC